MCGSASHRAQTRRKTRVVRRLGVLLCCHHRLSPPAVGDASLRRDALQGLWAQRMLAVPREGAPGVQQVIQMVLLG